MKAEAVATARAPASHRRFSKSFESWKAFVMATPIMEEKTWPKMMLRGCARCEEMLLYSRIAEAPKLASMTGEEL